VRVDFVDETPPERLAGGTRRFFRIVEGMHPVGTDAGA
jgi:hypothetical protein